MCRIDMTSYIQDLSGLKVSFLNLLVILWEVAAYLHCIQNYPEVKNKSLKIMNLIV